MKIFSAEQIRQWDNYTIEHEPISPVDLMERAAWACCTWIINHFNRFGKIIVFCGVGKNGGDGLAIARILSQANYSVTAIILDGEKRSDEFSTNLERLTAAGVDVQILASTEFPSIDKDTIIIDALFGTGLNRPLAGTAKSLIAHLNSIGATIVSIDLPSGLFADKSSLENHVIRATHTLSFQFHKPAFLLGENAKYIGNLQILDIGLHAAFYQNTPAQLYTIDETEINSIYKPRDPFSHKYNFGHALLYAGSKGMMGAAILCARACLRAGAGLVTTHTRHDTAGIMQTAVPEAITSFEDDWKRLSIKKAAIAIGPGLENSIENESRLKDIIEGFKGSVVVDAMGLQLLTKNLEILKKRTGKSVVLTPHSGEFENLFGKTASEFDRMTLCKRKAAELNCYIILKGHHTLIACPTGELYFNMNGNAGMATAGSGDVLTGIITGLLAQDYTARSACLLGVFLHGLAGDIAAEKFSQEALIAGDIIESLGQAFKKAASP